MPAVLQMLLKERASGMYRQAALSDGLACPESAVGAEELVPQAGRMQSCLMLGFVQSETATSLTLLSHACQARHVDLGACSPHRCVPFVSTSAASFLSQRPQRCNQALPEWLVRLPAVQCAVVRPAATLPMHCLMLLQAECLLLCPHRL